MASRSENKRAKAISPKRMRKREVAIRMENTDAREPTDRVHRVVAFKISNSSANLGKSRLDLYTPAAHRITCHMNIPAPKIAQFESLTRSDRNLSRETPFSA